jgi:hypothetical protein
VLRRYCRGRWQLRATEAHAKFYLIFVDNAHGITITRIMFEAARACGCAVTVDCAQFSAFSPCD